MIHTQPSNLRLDAGESVFFSRALEAIDKQVYETIFAENKARELIPTQQGIPDWAKTYTWRLFTSFGTAKIAANMADDIPRADVTGEEASKIIKPVVASHGYDLFEIKAAAATGMPLDSMKAMAARFAIESEIDSLLANGSSAHNLEGLLSIASGTTSYTLGTKAAGGLTWAVATSDEIAADLFGAPSAIIAAMKNAGGPVFARFVIAIPVSQYALIAQKRMGDGSDSTILNFVKGNSPYIEDIVPWHHCTLAGSGVDRMVCYPRNPMVVAGIVPMEFTSQPPEQRNLEFVVNSLATCGGIVVRYPVAVAYGDGL